MLSVYYFSLYWKNRYERITTQVILSSKLLGFYFDPRKSGKVKEPEFSLKGLYKIIIWIKTPRFQCSISHHSINSLSAIKVLSWSTLSMLSLLSHLSIILTCLILRLNNRILLLKDYHHCQLLLIQVRRGKLAVHVKRHIVWRCTVNVFLKGRSAVKNAVVWTAKTLKASSSWFKTQSKG